MAQKDLRIKLILKGEIINASLYGGSSISKSIYDMLPITAIINTWGEELYFPLYLNRGLDHPVKVVCVGDIAYSETWNAFCIFYGKTPYSNSQEIISNGPVDIVGRVDDPLIFKKLLSGFFKEKKRRIFNRIPVLHKYAETIKVLRLNMETP